MVQINRHAMSMKRLYDLALAEGEGLGTAYEYYVKLRLINRLLGDFEPRSILIYGLPEKYGYSMDFICYGKMNRAAVSVYEQRTEKILEHKRILKKLGLPEPDYINKAIECDLLLSCEVAQRDKKIIDAVQKVKKSFVFVPNADNKGHSRVSGLRGLTIIELQKMFPGSKYGYVDMPPFPPGIRKKKKTSNPLLLIVLRFLGCLECFLPFKRRYAHIVYLTK